MAVNTSAGLRGDGWRKVELGQQCAGMAHRNRICVGQQHDHRRYGSDSREVFHEVVPHKSKRPCRGIRLAIWEACIFAVLSGKGWNGNGQRDGSERIHLQRRLGCDRERIEPDRPDDGSVCNRGSGSRPDLPERSELAGCEHIERYCRFRQSGFLCRRHFTW